MDKKKARVVIVTGDPGSGKSTLVERLTGKLKEQGFKCSGFMARGFWEGGVRSGFDIETLDRGDVLPLPRRVSGRIGMPFDFFDDGISSGLAALEPQRCEGADMVVVDEVGKLESAGKGWAPKLSGLLELDGPLHVWVVRRSLVDEVKSIWELEDPLVIDAVESDAFEKLERKCCNLLHHGG